MNQFFPVVLREVAEVIGEADAWRLLEACHAHYERIGSKAKQRRAYLAHCYIPGKRAFPQWILDAIGEESAEALRAAMPNRIIEMPTGATLAKRVRGDIARSLFYDCGLPVSMIARVLSGRAGAVAHQIEKPLQSAAVRVVRCDNERCAA